MTPRLHAILAEARHRIQTRGFWLALLVICAVAYYGSYYRHSLNFRDEGGTETLLAQRLLNGEKPFLDVTLGYNVLWFYPIVGLFKFFGVNFVLLRAYCFALSTLTAVLGFFTLERVSRRPWAAFLVCLIPVLVPGMTFKNYMPLLAVANGCCLAHFALSKRRTVVWLAIGAVTLGLTYLIRIDVGLFGSVLWLGAIWVRGWHDRHWKLALGGPVLLLTVVVAVHVPVYLDARHRGFADGFVAQYSSWPKSFLYKLPGALGHPEPKAVTTSPAATPAPAPSIAPAANLAKAPLANHETLRRKAWHDLLNFEKPDAQQLTALLYLPILFLAFFAVWALGCLVSSVRADDHRGFRRALAALLLVGAALTTFPQYFFFRPDSPHLSEFSPGFWIGVAACCFLLGHWRSWATRLVILLLMLHAGLYLWRMLPDRWTGTIAARKNRSFRFHGANGVDVILGRREVEALNAMNQIIQSHSKPGEYLVAYPYHPAVNVLADRPSYEKNVYIDNATSHPNWSAEAIARFEKFRPAVIVLSDWPVNDTEDSRFSHWAADAQTWIETHYIDQGRYLEFEVFTREK